MRPEEIINKLNLIPLPQEGGFYIETWVSENYTQGRPLGTAIYFLLVNSHDGFSALHSLSNTEIYHFYLGDPFELSLFHKNGKVDQIIMGPDILSGQHPQFTVSGDTIQGSKLIQGGEFALIGTTMTPGFTFDDFTLNSRKEMIKKYPGYKDLILSLTRD